MSKKHPSPYLQKIEQREKFIHDIKNQLTIIQGYLQLVLENNLGAVSADAKKNLRFSLKASQKIPKLLEGFRKL